MRQSTSLADSIDQSGRHIGDRIQARLIDFSSDIDPLVPERRYGNIHLGLFDITGQAIRDHVTDLSDFETFHVDDAHIGVKDGAVVVDPVTGFFRATQRACRDGQLRVVPDSDLQHITGANLIIVLIVRKVNFIRHAFVDRMYTLPLENGRADSMNFHHIRKRLAFRNFVFVQKPARGRRVVSAGHHSTARDESDA